MVIPLLADQDLTPMFPIASCSIGYIESKILICIAFCCKTEASIEGLLKDVAYRIASFHSIFSISDWLYLPWQCDYAIDSMSWLRQYEQVW